MPGEALAIRTVTVSAGGISIGGVAESKACSSEAVFMEQIAANQTNLAVTFPIDVSRVLVLSIGADKDITLKTNSTSSPLDTLNLLANKPRHWFKTTDPDSEFFIGGADGVAGTDITTIYVSTGAAATLLKIIVGFDATV